MILKGSQRAGGLQLARHLLNDRDNDHVTVQELRGFVSDNLHDAFNKAHAISRGMKCKQFLFSLSLNPPETERVSVDVFERAIAEIEDKLGLSNQPRAIIFHEKEGRRHAHCVWSRIDVNQMKAINLPHYKLKLRDMSRQLYLENNWKMPRGLVNSEERNPLNFTMAEWQQAKRIQRDPRVIKETFQDCWAISTHAKLLPERLRSAAIISLKVIVVAMSPWTGTERFTRFPVGSASVQRTSQHGLARLMMPSIKGAREKVSERFVGKLQELLTEAQRQNEQAFGTFEAERQALVTDQRRKRIALAAKHRERWQTEAHERSSRFPTGLKAFWFRLLGQYRTIKQQNEIDASTCRERDQREIDDLIFAQLRERVSLQHEKRILRHRQEVLDRRLNREVQRYRQLAGDETDSGPTLSKRSRTQYARQSRRPRRTY